MKLELNVIHSCAIKRKKPWHRLSWIGKEKQNIFLLGNQRVSVLDPKNGKTKKKVNIISSLIKNSVTYNLSNSKTLFVGVLSTGDVFVWNKDTDVVKHILGLNEFGYKLGYHSSSVFINDDASLISLITTRNKVYLFEPNQTPNFTAPKTCISKLSKQEEFIEGNWSHVQAPKDIIIIEDSKEMILSAKFHMSKNSTQSFTYCFTFNYENDKRLILTILNLKWLNKGELATPSMTRFEAKWKSIFPSMILHKYEPLCTRDSLVCDLSNNTSLLALACNQKYAHQTSLLIIQTCNGAIFEMNLRTFGLKDNSKGRHYWIQDLKWTNDDLYLIGITKHGALFIASRLGHPILIHTIGNEFDLGPALFITLHPLVIIKSKSSNTIQNDEHSLNSNIENNDTMRQHYSLNIHPTLPLILCSDGFLVAVLRIGHEYASQSGLLRQMAIASTNLIKTFSSTINTNKYLNITSNNEAVDKHEQLPNWGLISQNELGCTDESDLDNEQIRITDGKMIFSYIPQIMPISFEKLHKSKLNVRVEILYELIQNQWNLISSSFITDENFKSIINLIVKLFDDFIKLIIKMDNESLREMKSFDLILSKAIAPEGTLDRLYDEFKLKMIIISFLHLMSALYFNTHTNLLAKYSPKLLNRFIATILRDEKYFQNINLFALLKILYSLIKISHNLVNNLNKSSANFNGIKELLLFIDNKSDLIFDDIRDETLNEILMPNKLLNKSWKLLLRHTKKYQQTILFTNQQRNFELNEINKLIILIESQIRVKVDYSIREKQLFNIDYAYELYMCGNLKGAVDKWKQDLNEQLKLNTTKSVSRASRICHQILYACLNKYNFIELIDFLNDYLLLRNSNSSINLYINTFNHLEPPKQVYLGAQFTVKVLKSFARFLALYFLNKKPLLIPTEPNPITSILNSKYSLKQVSELLHENVTNSIKKTKKLSKIFNIEKTIEIFILTGLYDEAVYFAFSLNDWKSSFLMSVIIRESLNAKYVVKFLPDYLRAENLIINQVLNVLDYNNSTGRLLDKVLLDKQNQMLSQLLLCSVLTKLDIFSPLLKGLLEALIKLVKVLPFRVADQFYLPAPPMYGTQNMIKNEDDECDLRNKIANIVKCIIQLLKSSNLHVPLIKWYLEELRNVSIQMNTTHGVKNTFELSQMLNDLLKLLRFQKISYIASDILSLFRDFCSILYYLHVRDQFTLTLRALSTGSFKNKLDKLDETCLNLIDYGNLMLSFIGFGKHDEKLQIFDIVLSTIAREVDLEDVYSMNLYSKLCNALEKIDDISLLSENIQDKFKMLMNKWKEFKTSYDSTLWDIFNQQLKIQKSTMKRINALYGLNEDALIQIYVNKKSFESKQHVGSYEYERSHLCINFFELFFEIGFDSWDNLVKLVNATPLLPPFYDKLVEQNLPNDYPDRSCIINGFDLKKLKQNYNKKPNKLASTVEFKKSYQGLFDDNNNFQHGHFTINNSTSLIDLRGTLDSTKLLKSASLTHLNNTCWYDCEEDQNDTHEERDLNKFKVLDYGLKYGKIMQLSIWLLEWSQKFNFSLEKHKISASKIKSINANFLVACVYLADNIHATNTAPKKSNKLSINDTDAVLHTERTNDIISDEFTEITQAIQKQQQNRIPTPQPRNSKAFENHNNDEEQSSTLEISSINQYDINIFSSNNNNNNNNTESPEWTLTTKTPSPIKLNRLDRDSDDIITHISPLKFEHIKQSSPYKKSPHMEPQVYSPIKKDSQNELRFDDNRTMHDMIRNELKNIVKLQHNTVMNFLNGETHIHSQQNPLSEIEFNMINQIQKFSSSKDGSEKKPMDFVIETRVKTKKSNEPVETSRAFKQRSPSPTKNYFKKNFDYWPESHTIKDSKYIGIPLLGYSNNNRLNRNSLLDEFSKKKKFPVIQKPEKTKPDHSDIEFLKSNFKLLQINKKQENRSAYPISKQADLKYQFAHKPVQLLTIRPKVKRENQEPVEQVTRNATNEDKKEIIVNEPVRQDIAQFEKIVETRPFNDGYVIKQNSLADVPFSCDQVEFSSAEAHYISTEYLRDVPLQKPLKKEIHTMTDNTNDANVLVPDILFKLKFNPEKKERGLVTPKTEHIKDFVNVVDINSKDIEIILNAMEQNKSQRKQNNVFKIENSNELDYKNKNSTSNLNKIEEENIVKQDALTEKLLKDNDSTFFHATLHENIMSSRSRVKSKKHMQHEINLIDDKIKMMSEMALDIEQDFDNYNRIIDTLTIQTKINESIQPAPNVIDFIHEERAKELEKDNKLVYQPKEASERIENLRESMKTQQSKKVVTIAKTPLTFEFEKDTLGGDSTLSDIKDFEEEKVKKILNIDSTRVASDLLLDSLDDNDKEMRERKFSNSPSRDVSTSRKKSHSPGLNSTYKIPTSPIVLREKEKARKRDSIKKSFMEARANEAKDLLIDLFSDTTKIIPRIRSASRENEDSLPIDGGKLYCQNTSLMTKTIEKLADEDTYRWRQDVAHYQSYQPKENIDLNTRVIKVINIKPFTDYVHLQEPVKLNHKLNGKPQTYSERLSRHQDATVRLSNVKKDSKIYGTKRIPGVFKVHSRPTEQRKIKTYSERLKELKPPKSVQIVKEPFKPKLPEKVLIKKTSKNTKAKIKRETQERFFSNSDKGAENLNTEAIDDLSPWSVDENIKKILYGNLKQSVDKIKSKIKSYHDVTDQDTLADIDCYYQLIDDVNPNNEQIDQFINELINDNETIISGNSINTEDVRNLVSLSNESGSSYIDWDQIADMAKDYDIKKK